jgi:coenzyme F420-0:L-glutamate ligase
LLVYPIRAKKINPGDSLVGNLVQALNSNHFELQDYDIVVISSKVISISEGRLRKLSSASPSSKARALAKKFLIEPEFVQILLDEADRVIGGVKGALLTVAQGDAIANAGIDRKNAPAGTVVLWPSKPDLSAETLRRQLGRIFKIKLGIIIVDSRVTPLRLGTIGMAIGCAGISPIRDYRHKPDINRRRITMTLQAVADGVAAAAQLVMGEAAEKIPFVIIRDAPVSYLVKSGMVNTKLKPQDCLYMSQLAATKKI